MENSAVVQSLARRTKWEEKRLLTLPTSSHREKIGKLVHQLNLRNRKGTFPLRRCFVAFLLSFFHACLLPGMDFQFGPSPIKSTEAVLCTRKGEPESEQFQTNTPVWKTGVAFTYPPPVPGCSSSSFFVLREGGLPPFIIFSFGAIPRKAE